MPAKAGIHHLRPSLPTKFAMDPDFRRGDGVVSYAGLAIAATGR
jgi:hypothetical protein